MTEPQRNYQCPRCAQWSRLPGWCENCRGQPRSQRQLALLNTYAELRANCAELEATIAALPAGEFTEEDLTRLDKGVTVMKVGFKLVKKVLRRHGHVGNLKVKQEEPQ